jgi:hypothetical protein
MRRIFLVALFIATILSSTAVDVHAEETYTAIPAPYEPTLFRFNNDNWFTAPHPKVATFTVHEDGSAHGLTENGVYFTQYNVPNEVGIRVQRFEIQDHYHYIVEGEPVYSFTELSIRLAQASTV